MRNALVLGFIVAAAAWAQSISAELSGFVRDAQGLAVQSARVVATNRGTGLELQADSDTTGAFRFPSVPPGTYTVSMTAAGFAKVTFEAIPLTVGQARRLDAELQPEARSDEITITADQVAEVGLDAGGAGKTYNALQMNDLPNITGGAGRNFNAQVYLTPAVTPANQAHRPFSVAGARSRNNSYKIDSNDYNEIEGGLLMGRGASEQLISVEAIEGMQVLTHGYKAEYGRNNGAIISMVTKRGTNDWHGSVYSFIRNDALNARNTFDLQRPPLKVYQPGFTVGGPVRQDRTFLFGNFESLDRRFANTTTIQTFTPEQRRTAAPSVQPLVAMYPEPNIPGTNLFRSRVGLIAGLRTFLLRADHSISDRQRLMARSVHLATDTETAAGAALSRAHRDIGSQSHSLHHSWAPSAGVLNEARFQFARFKILDFFDDPLQLGDLAVNGEVGFVTAGGLSPLGHFSFMAQRNFQNSFQWSDDLSLHRGRHVVKTGVAIRRQQLNNGRFNNAFVGQLRFLNAASFLAGRPVSYSRNVGNPFVGLRASEFNAYVQDDWQIHPRLMLNLGVRYELNTVPLEVNGLIPESYRFRGDHNNIAPRIAFALRADRGGRTVLRGSYGIFYNVLELSFIGLTRFNPPLITNYVASNPTLPNLLATAQASIPSGLVIPDRNLRTPYANQFNLRLERQLFGPSATVAVGYLGTTGVKLPRNGLPNGGDGMAQAQRPDPNIGVINRLTTDTTSNYHAMESSFSWRGRGLLLRGSYTFSKFLDHLTDYPSSNTGIERNLLALDENNLRLNRGPADFDIRHIGSFFYSYDLPLFRGNRFAGGWQLQGITMLMSGRPYTLFSGTDTPIGSNSNRILDVPGSLMRFGGSNRTAIALAEGFDVISLTPARGTIGTIGRNTERGDGFTNFNVSLAKSFRVAERVSAQFRIESSNLFNHVNYQLPDGVLNSRNFGQAVSAFEARQLQLALKLTF
ncbi:MAG: carboxypeptidase regulatory-like domain-containing protein [Bryobacteraceae bacterium]